MEDLLIIGGGPSGLMAAIQAKRLSPQLSVHIFEKNDRVGKKILASGNGHCNYTNATAIPTHYNHPSFVSDIFAQFSPQATRAWFADLGMMDRVDDTGRCYPYNQLASSVLDMLRFEVERLGVVVHLTSEVTKLISLGTTWRLVTSDSHSYEGRAVIISAGGVAAPQLGTSGQGHQLAEQLGHHIRKPNPAIVMIEVNKELVKDLAGIRVDGAIELRKNKQLVRRELGEILFKDNAISGICTFILSSFIARDSSPATDFELNIDALPELSIEEIERWLRRRAQSVDLVSLDNLFTGLVHKLVAQKALIFAHLPLRFTKESIDYVAIAKALKSILFPVKSLGPFMHAQTTSGGILVKEIDRQSLASRIREGLFFAGEVIDVDGECGGYSLQWAWSSGYVAGVHASQYISKKAS